MLFYAQKPIEQSIKLQNNTYKVKVNINIFLNVEHIILF